MLHPSQGLGVVPPHMTHMGHLDGNRPPHMLYNQPPPTQQQQQRYDGSEGSGGSGDDDEGVDGLMSLMGVTPTSQQYLQPAAPVSMPPLHAGGLLQQQRRPVPIQVPHVGHVGRYDA